MAKIVTNPAERRLQQVLTIVGGFMMPLGLVVIGIGWWGTAHTGYLFEQVPYLVSGGLFGLALAITGSLVFFSAWLARIVQLQRQQVELLTQLAAAESAAATADSAEQPAQPKRRDTIPIPRRQDA